MKVTCTGKETRLIIILNGAEEVEEEVVVAPLPVNPLHHSNSKNSNLDKIREKDPIKMTKLLIYASWRNKTRAPWPNFQITATPTIHLGG